MKQSIDWTEQKLRDWVIRGFTGNDRKEVMDLISAMANEISANKKRSNQLELALREMIDISLPSEMIYEAIQTQRADIEFLQVLSGIDSAIANARAILRTEPGGR